MRIENLNEKLDGKEKVSEKELRFLCKNHKDFNLTKLDTSEVTNMSKLFQYAEDFNQDIGEWNTSDVTDMSHIFDGAKSFNQDLSGWDVYNVTNMDFIFQDAEAFNYDLNGWVLSNVRSLRNVTYASNNPFVGGLSIKSIYEIIY